MKIKDSEPTEQQAEHLYLIDACHQGCGARTRFVEPRDEPVGLMQDVTLSATYCPSCGDRVDEWDVHEESYVERAPDPTEVG